MAREAERRLLAALSVPVCLWGSPGVEARTQHSGAHANGLESGTGEGRRHSDKSLVFFPQTNLKRKRETTQE